MEEGTHLPPPSPGPFLNMSAAGLPGLVMAIFVVFSFPMLFVSRPWQALLFVLEMAAIAAVVASSAYRWWKGDSDPIPSLLPALPPEEGTVAQGSARLVVSPPIAARTPLRHSLPAILSLAVCAYTAICLCLPRPWQDVLLVLAFAAIAAVAIVVLFRRRADADEDFPSLTSDASPDDEGSAGAADALQTLSAPRRTSHPGPIGRAGGAEADR